MQFSRRQLIAGAAGAAFVAIRQGRAIAQSGRNPGAIQSEIELWIADNSDSLTITQPEGRGSLILAPDDPRVRQAAAELAKVPDDRAPIEIVRYMIKNFTDASRMEW